MIRFRNPGTQYTTQVQVFKELYKEYKDAPSFDLDDMASTITKTKLMTAYGYAGDAALALSNTENDSLNSTKMNAKMYAEVFRLLGWITSAGSGSYPLVFTYIGFFISFFIGLSMPLFILNRDVLFYPESPIKSRNSPPYLQSVYTPTVAAVQQSLTSISIRIIVIGSKMHNGAARPGSPYGKRRSRAAQVLSLPPRHAAYSFLCQRLYFCVKKQEVST